MIFPDPSSESRRVRLPLAPPGTWYALALMTSAAPWVALVAMTLWPGLR